MPGCAVSAKLEPALFPSDQATPSTFADTRAVPLVLPPGFGPGLVESPPQETSSAMAVSAHERRTNRSVGMTGPDWGMRWDLYATADWWRWPDWCALSAAGAARGR